MAPNMTRPGPGRLSIDGKLFRDSLGRSVLLRGVNLGGDCKVPVSPDGHTYRPTDFSDHRTVSFVGRPFPLEEADAHLGRLARWGFNCLRLLLTWEAVEHAGPGQHDEAFLDYFAAVCRKAGEHGFYVFIDFHQDVWSRMSGGDGAPGWTFEAAGLDFTKFDRADAAHVMQYRYDHRRGGLQPSYPQMSWASNYRMPANGIMWTLFFAGAHFAPSLKIDGQNIQAFLQSHYLGAMRAVAERVADCDHVIGFDTLNEPGTGYIGRRLTQPLSSLPGAQWTALAGLAVASGHPQTLMQTSLTGSEPVAREMNPSGVSIWLPGHEDPFRAAGVWDIDEAGVVTALADEHFARRDGREIDVEADYMAPFFNKVARTVRQVREDWLIFAELNPFAALTGGTFPENCPPGTVNASHWYDLTALVTKTFNAAHMPNLLTGGTREGPDAIRNGYVEELGRVQSAGDTLNGGAPTLIGEFGIPYDMNDRKAYEAWAAGDRNEGIWGAHEEALGLMYDALDALLLHSTQWNYTASNRNDAMVGDGWNQEDLSIWSADQMVDPVNPDSGARALPGFSRPYVRATPGRLLRQTFDAPSGRFQAEIEIDQGDRTAILYIPPCHFPDGCHVSFNGGPPEALSNGELHLRLPSSANCQLTVKRPDTGKI